MPGAKDAYRDQPHGAGHTVAIFPEVLEGFVTAFSEVHIDAIDQGKNVFLWNIEAVEDVTKTSQNRMRHFPIVARQHIAPPLLEPGTSDVGFGDLLIDEIIGIATKIIDVLYRLSLLMTQERERK